MSKQIKTLALIFAALLLVVVALFVVPNQTGDEGKKRLFDFDEQAVSEFQINYFTTGYRFRSTEQGWQIKKNTNPLVEQIKKGNPDAKVGESGGEFVPANSAYVAKALTYLMTLKVAQPISDNPESLKWFHINPHALHVVLYDKKGIELDTLLIGKQGPDAFRSFVKRKSDKNVYLVDENFQALLHLGYDEWLAKDDKKR